MVLLLFFRHFVPITSISIKHLVVKDVFYVLYIYIYIYIHVERERERERESVCVCVPSGKPLPLGDRAGLSVWRSGR